MFAFTATQWLRVLQSQPQALQSPLDATNYNPTLSANFVEVSLQPRLPQPLTLSGTQHSLILLRQICVS